MANIDTPLKSEQEIWNAIYDTVNNRLCFTTANSNPPTTLLSEQEILNRVYDSSTNSLLIQ